MKMLEIGAVSQDTLEVSLESAVRAPDRLVIMARPWPGDARLWIT